MIYNSPLPPDMSLDDALKFVFEKFLHGSAWSANQYDDVAAEIKIRALFSAHVEGLRVLQDFKDGLTNFLSGARVTLPNGETMLATGSRAAFVDQMRKKLNSYGIGRTSGDIKDITSEQRLGLIFDINTTQAQSYAYWKQGMTPEILDEFPAMRFIRVRSVKEPRAAHAPFQDEVYLKTDSIWWKIINKDFGVPWAPWGWQCGHDVEDVDRDEAEALGLLKRGQKIDSAPIQKFNLNHDLQFSVKTIDPDLLKVLLDEFKNELTYDEQQQVIRLATSEKKAESASPQ